MNQIKIKIETEKDEKLLDKIVQAIKSNIYKDTQIASSAEFTLNLREVLPRNDHAGAELQIPGYRFPCRR